MVTKEGLVIIDTTESAEAAGEILAELRKITKAPVHTIIYTHYHPDHNQGTAAFYKEGVRIIATKDNVEYTNYQNVMLGPHHLRSRATQAGGMAPEFAFDLPVDENPFRAIGQKVDVIMPTVTFDREKGLAREDMAFVTWEHPMILEAMEMVHSTELGNAAIGTIKLKGVPAGTMLLEALYTINCVAPRALQVERFLPLSPIRLLVDASGKQLADLVPHARLNSLVEKVQKSTALAIIKQVHKEVDAKMRLANAQAEEKLQHTLADAESRMRADLGAELARLEALRQLNPAIREEELAHLRYRIDECALHIQHASLQLQALRLIITT